MHRRPSIENIRRYVRGELSPAEMYEIERLSQSDEILMDLIQGIETEHRADQAPMEKAILQHHIQARVHTLQQERATRHPDQHETSPRIKKLPHIPIAVAASLLVILGVGLTIWLARTPTTPELVATRSADSIPERRLAIPSHPDLIESAPDAPTNPPEERDREGTRLAYQSRKRAATNTSSQTSASGRKASLDTISIQIIPSNTEELVSLSLSEDRSTMMAYRNSNKSQSFSPNRSSAVRGSMASRTSPLHMNRTEVYEIKSITNGIVLDHETRRPIRGASIQGSATDSTITTDASGRFVLGSSEESTTILIQASGFEPVQRAAEGSMRIEMMRQRPLQSTAAPSGTNPRIAASIKSEPIAGMNAYQVYTDSVARHKEIGPGEVTLLFDINSQGRPSNIRVKKGSGSPLSREAIKILEEGPDWIPDRPTNNLEWTIRF